MELKQWLTTLSAELETGDVMLDDDAIHTLLDLARDSAHEVERLIRLKIQTLIFFNRMKSERISPIDTNQRSIEQEGPTEEEKQRLYSLLREMEEFSKKPWFKTVTEGVLLGTTRLMQKGVGIIIRKQKDGDDLDHS